ncbi:hypothetical protein SISNIDRAFT_471593 [Sistotremastrum niveocremeum HHB9708]|uniref:Uncharacterized protein n=1 Tax=Sistotremastrum niveocremeum HHB9708 TaxID=1314777 RepID=A0A164MFK0_9AGAM|nr:hypothetical protein SISNIDRAFT_471593 [Sistotremastrum niveocremeum HHB9708]
MAPRALGSQRYDRNASGTRPTATWFDLLEWQTSIISIQVLFSIGSRRTADSWSLPGRKQRLDAFKLTEIAHILINMDAPDESHFHADALASLGSLSTSESSHHDFTPASEPNISTTPEELASSFKELVLNVQTILNTVKDDEQVHGSILSAIRDIRTYIETRWDLRMQDTSQLSSDFHDHLDNRLNTMEKDLSRTSVDLHKLCMDIINLQESFYVKLENIDIQTTSGRILTRISKGIDDLVKHDLTIVETHHSVAGGNNLFSSSSAHTISFCLSVLHPAMLPKADLFSVASAVPSSQIDSLQSGMSEIQEMLKVALPSLHAVSSTTMSHDCSQLHSCRRLGPLEDDVSAILMSQISLAHRLSQLAEVFAKKTSDALPTGTQENSSTQTAKLSSVIHSQTSEATIRLAAPEALDRIHGTVLDIRESLSQGYTPTFSAEFIALTTEMERVVEYDFLHCLRTDAKKCHAKVSPKVVSLSRAHFVALIIVNILAMAVIVVIAFGRKSDVGISESSGSYYSAMALEGMEWHYE